MFGMSIIMEQLLFCVSIIRNLHISAALSLYIAMLSINKIPNLKLPIKPIHSTTVNYHSSLNMFQGNIFCLFVPQRSHNLFFCIISFTLCSSNFVFSFILPLLFSYSICLRRRFMLFGKRMYIVLCIYIYIYIVYNIIHHKHISIHSFTACTRCRFRQSGQGLCVCGN